MFIKRTTFLIVVVNWLIGLSCQTVQPVASVDKNSPKRYNWHQRQIHPSFAIEQRDSSGTTIAITILSKTFEADFPSFLDINAHVMEKDSMMLYHQRFEILPIPAAAKGQWIGYLKIPAKAKILQDIVLKFGPNGMADQYYLNWPLEKNGWITPDFIDTKTIAAGEKIIKSGNGRTVFAPLSDKLPSPPFSNNPPFVPETFETFEKDSAIAQPGAYLYYLDNGVSSIDMVHAFDKTLHPAFPEFVTTSELAGPMRYLCSKEEYEKIQKSTDGPENAMEKFWIQSAGGKEKARALIKTYYQRVWDANHHFTSYAEGWKTDRGMIYLIFGHPEKIDIENNLEIWSYTLETGQLQFAFESKKHPLWGEIFILKRNEQYRPHWEFQVSQWRQGRIFK